MRDKDYEVLLNKYNMVVAQLKEMQDQMKRKDTAQKQYEKEMDVVMDHARKLCEKILAKNPEEMVLGDARTWHTFSTDELIKKAMKSFDWYVKDRASILSQIMDISEQRGAQIESLKDQISQTILHGNVAQSSSTVEEYIKKAEEDARKKQAMSKADNAMKQAAQQGKIKMVVTEYTDDEEAEMAEIERQMQTAEVVKTTPKSVPVGKCQQQVDNLKKMKDNVVQSHLVDLNKYVESRTESEWNILEIIGKYGTSKYVEIQSVALDRYNITKAVLRTNCAKLANINAIESTSFSLPLSPAAKFYKLTEFGARLYRAKFNEDPVESELEKVIKEHSSAEHGYGILDVQNVLSKMDKYVSVVGFNRHSPINVNIDGRKLQYVPDIVCKDKNGYNTYIEYEMNTSNQSDFNEKCNKMCRVTKKLFFVVCKKSELEKIKKKIDKWIESRGAKNLKGYSVIITTAVAIKKNEPNPIEYDLSKGALPTKCAL